MKSARGVVVTLAIACVASLGFIAAYATGAGPHLMGLAFAVAAGALGWAAVAWSRLLPAQTVTDEIDDYPSASAERRASADELQAGTAELSRHRVLARWLYGALGLFFIAALVPLRSLGAAPGLTLFGTKWRRGVRLRREDGRLVHVDDLNVDSTVTVFPDGALGDAQSQTVLIRLPDGLEPATRGYIAYSRVCTHAGCPVALYRAAAKQLMCPCHQSVFDVTRDGAVVSGPADHALPRLPIAVGADGILRAGGGFAQAVGPGFWERA